MVTYSWDNSHCSSSSNRYVVVTNSLSRVRQTAKLYGQTARLKRKTVLKDRHVLFMTNAFSRVDNVILAYIPGCLGQFWQNYAAIMTNLCQFMSLAFIYWKNRRRSAISVPWLLWLIKTKIVVAGIVCGNYSGKGLYIFDSQISPMEGSHLRRKKTQGGGVGERWGSFSLGPIC